MSVIVNAPAVFRFTAQVNPERHLHAARLLGADTNDAHPDDAGEVLAAELIRIMRAVNIPNGLSGVGYTENDITALTEGAFPQQRLLAERPAGDEQTHSGRVVSQRRCGIGSRLGPDQLRVELGRHPTKTVTPVNRGGADEFSHPRRVGGITAQRLRALLEDRLLADQRTRGNRTTPAGSPSGRRTS